LNDFSHRPHLFISKQSDRTQFKLFCVLINRNKKSKQNGSLVWTFSQKRINISSYFSFEIDEPIYIHILRHRYQIADVTITNLSFFTQLISDANIVKITRARKKINIGYVSFSHLFDHVVVDIFYCHPFLLCFAIVV
jgi:hypothetical protein